MYITARHDYAVQAMLAIASRNGGPITSGVLAAMQGIPANYLTSILTELRRAGLLMSRTGVDGGFSLTRPAESISVGDVLRAVSGEMVTVRGRPPHTIRYTGAAASLSSFWQSVHLAIREVLDTTTIGALVSSARSEEELLNGGPVGGDELVREADPDGSVDRDAQ